MTPSIQYESKKNESKPVFGHPILIFISFEFNESIVSGLNRILFSLKPQINHLNKWNTSNVFICKYYFRECLIHGNGYREYFIF